MIDVIHATACAIEVITKRLPDYQLPHWSSGCQQEQVGVRACDRLSIDLSLPVFQDVHSWDLLAGRPVRRLPTCLRCRQLLDEALDPTAERDRRVAAAWGAVADALKETT